MVGYFSQEIGHSIVHRRYLKNIFGIIYLLLLIILDNLYDNQIEEIICDKLWDNLVLFELVNKKYYSEFSQKLFNIVNLNLNY